MRYALGVITLVLLSLNVAAARVDAIDDFLRDDPLVRGITYFGYFYGASQSDRTSEANKLVLAQCVVNHSMKELMPDIERDMRNLARISTSPIVDVGPIIAKAAWAACVRRIQR